MISIMFRNGGYQVNHFSLKCRFNLHKWTIFENVLGLFYFIFKFLRQNRVNCTFSMKELRIFKIQRRKKILIFLKIFGKGTFINFKYILKAKTAFQSKIFRRRPHKLSLFYLLGTHCNRIKRRLVGENVIGIFGNVTEQIFKYYA